MTVTGRTVTPRVHWDAARRRLLVTYGTRALSARREVVAAPATVVLDGHGTALDVDIKALPDRVSDALSRYAVSRRRPPRDGIALDVDAAWLWLHLAEGTAAQRLSGTARVRLVLDGTDVVEVEVALPPTTAPTPGGSR